MRGLAPRIHDLGLQRFEVVGTRIRGHDG